MLINQCKRVFRSKRDIDPLHFKPMFELIEAADSNGSLMQYYRQLGTQLQETVVEIDLMKLKTPFQVYKNKVWASKRHEYPSLNKQQLEELIHSDFRFQLSDEERKECIKTSEDLK